MKKFEITEEQIKELTDTLHKERVNYLLKEWFPEAFEPQLKVGAWYIVDGNKCGQYGRKLLANFSGVEQDNNYGFCFLGNWSTDLTIYHKELEECTRLATDEEVEKALINEAMKRYKLPQKIKYLDGENKTDELLGYDLTYRNNQLGASGGYNDLLFKDGVWAEIVKEPVTLNYQQIADKFGIDVEQLRITK